MRFLCLLLALSLLLSACSGVVPPPRSADSYMKEGDDFFARKRYDDAIAAWEKVRERYVSPEMNAAAELKIADAQFQSEHFVEAAVAYEAFLKQHPEHERLADVLYRLGISYYREILIPERDQTTTGNALSAFETLLKRYPADPRRSEVEPLIADCRNHLAGHEFHIGHFYLRKKQYAAAIGRLQPILERFPDFDNKAEVYFDLGKAYLGSGKRPEAGEFFNRLYQEYPQSPLVKKAQKLLSVDY